MLRELSQSLPLSATVVLLILGLLLSWRLWMFTLKPLIFPSAPKVLPYWIPCHSIAFFRSSDKAIERGLRYVRYSYEPFALQVLGKKLYIISSPTDVTAVFRDTESLQFEGYLDLLLKNMGIKSKARKLAWHKPVPGDSHYDPNNKINPRHLDVIHFVEQAWRTQLLVEERRHEISTPFLKLADMWLQPDHLDAHALQTDCLWCGLRPCDMDHDGGGYPGQISLHSLCRVVFVEGNTRAIFGPHLHDIDPKVAEHMAQFNDSVWMILFNYPDLLQLPVTQAKDKLVAALSTFIQTPDHNKGSEAGIIKETLGVMEAAGLDVGSRATMILLSYWNAISNVGLSTFWILSYLLFDDSLFQLVRDETEAAWHQTQPDSRPPQLDIRYLCANAPYLDAILNEVLRLKNGSGAIREVLKDTTVGGKTLEAGNLAWIPFHQLHTNLNVWGSNAEDFDPFRFIKNKNLDRHPSFRPFGGGATLCPGTLLTKEEIFGFIAILLHRYDIRLATATSVGLKPGDNKKQEFPRMNDLVPSTGVNGPMPGMDIVVDIKMKTKV
ncbi:cytochrome P450 [Rhypophila decipiens]|uniref:Cytochrome P450 n=1 Tax=Rhypophila decipiens TaxID=261697 RepID=A0AAN6Y242_9PEZI|nr:cytochrome P450 [Rhypophila decipiens]